jgi:hypothetical protein
LFKFRRCYCWLSFLTSSYAESRWIRGDHVIWSPVFYWIIRIIVDIFADMFELAMGTNLSETQRNELENWQMKKLDGACTLPDSGWLVSRSTVSFSQDLGNVTRMMEGSVLTFMIPQKLLSVLSFWRVYVPLQTANWLIRFCNIWGPTNWMWSLHLLICKLNIEFNWFFLQVIPERMPDCSYFLQGAS